MTHNERLLKAISTQGEKLVERAEWYKKQIENQTKVVVVAQRTIENYSAELKAIEMQIDNSRADYRRELANGKGAEA